MTEVDNLYWYLMHTQDMPNTIEDEIIRYLHMVGKKYEVLSLYIDAELSGTKVDEIETEEEIPPTNLGQEFFTFEGEEEPPISEE